MNKEKLIATIMREAEADGEPVTREEAEEMAEMELKANKDCKRYEQSEVPKKKVERVRKVDTEKKTILEAVQNLVWNMQMASGETASATLKNEAEMSFTLYGNSYTLKLIKHRPPK